MPNRNINVQEVARRTPKQDRSRHKIGLIFEATMQLLDGVEISELTTNAIAAKAGISIGTLYQYFNDKDAILDALSSRELQMLGAKIMAAIDQVVRRSPEERLRLLVGAVFDTYGGRRRVHRLLLEHALTQGRGTRLNPLYAALTEEFTRQDRAGPRLTSAEAFVLTQAIGGVLRAVVASAYPAARRREIEDALVRLVTGFARRGN
jgi:AcrR family transcriptional regulator